MGGLFVDPVGVRELRTNFRECDIVIIPAYIIM